MKRYSYVKTKLKKSILSFSFVFYTFFLAVIIFSIYIFSSAYKTNRFVYDLVKNTINQSNTITPDSLRKICENLVDENGWKSKKSILLIIDTTSTSSMRYISQQFQLNQKNFIDGNGLTFIIGILSLVLIGLGIFGFQFFFQKIEKIEETNEAGIIRMSQQIKVSLLTNKLSKLTEIVYTNAIGLEGKSNNKDEIEICRLISSRLLDIQLLITNHKSGPFIVEQMTKQHSLDLLHQVKRIFFSKYANSTREYIKGIHNRIAYTINLIQDLEEIELK